MLYLVRIDWKSKHALDENLKSGLSEVFGGLCETCDVYPSNIVDVELNCSASGLVYLSAGLVYSSPDGRITASTLTTRFQTRLLSQDSTSILVNGTSVFLSKQCVAQLNNAKQRTCTQQFASVVTQETETAIIGGFFGGLAVGLVITVLFITIIILFR